jgi:hypothetical protein
LNFQVYPATLPAENFTENLAHTGNVSRVFPD